MLNSNLVDLIASHDDIKCLLSHQPAFMTQNNVNEGSYIDHCAYNLEVKVVTALLLICVE